MTPRRRTMLLAATTLTTTGALFSCGGHEPGCNGFYVDADAPDQSLEDQRVDLRDSGAPDAPDVLVDGSSDAGEEPDRD